jgi:hypothetical protein
LQAALDTLKADKDAVQKTNLLLSDEIASLKNKEKQEKLTATSLEELDTVRRLNDPD